MQLFYAPDIVPPIYTLSEEESKHCVRVLRLNVGDTLYITDGRGNLFCCNICEAHPKRCSVEVVSTQTEFERLPYNLTMAVAPTKNIERYEWFLEKATEVGVNTFIPLISSHSERKTIKEEREIKVITSAMKQSLKAYHPTLTQIMSFNEVINRPFDGVRLIAHCNPAQSNDGKIYLPRLVEAGANVEILIGPEGDFSPEEVSAALAAGYKEITLGDQRLRTETAALTAVVMVATQNYTK